MLVVSIKMDLEQIERGSVELIYLAWDWVHRQGIVNTVLIFGAHIYTK